MAARRLIRAAGIAALLVCAVGVISAQSPKKVGGAAANGNAAEPRKVTAESWDSAWRRDLIRFAANHASLASQFHGKHDLARAIRHWRLSLSLDTDNALARQKLGFVREDGKWIPGESMLDYPEPVDEATMTKAALEEHREKLKKREAATRPLVAEEARLSSQIAAVLAEHGKLAADSGLPSRARAALRLASAYAPGDPVILKARGFEAHGDEWLHPDLARAARAAEAFLAEASSGTKPEDPDPQGPDIGAAFHVRRDDTRAVAARSTISDGRAARLAAVGDGTIRLSKSLLGLDGKAPFEEGVFTITEVSSDKQYQDWLGKFDESTGALRLLNSRSTSCSTTKPFGSISIHFGDDRGDDAAANCVALAMLGNLRRGKVTAPWVRLGFSYLVTARMLGTTHIKRYEVENEGRTRDHSVDRNRKRKGLPYGPAEFRRLAAEMIRIGEDIPLATLAETPTNRMSERHIAKALSVMEFLMTAHGDKARAWLALHPKDHAGELESLAGVLGLDLAGLQSAWEAWVAERY